MLDDQVGTNADAAPSTTPDAAPASSDAGTPAADAPPAKKTAARKTAAKKAPAKKAAAPRTTAKKAAGKKTAAAPGAETPADPPTAQDTVALAAGTDAGVVTDAPTAPVRKTTGKRAAKTTKVAAPAPADGPAPEGSTADAPTEAEAEKPARKTAAKKTTARKTAAKKAAEAEASSDAGPAPAATEVLFQAPETKPARRTRKKAAAAPESDASGDAPTDVTPEPSTEPEAAQQDAADDSAEGGEGGGNRRRRRRGGRRRRKTSDTEGTTDGEESAPAETPEDADAEDSSESASSRRRRRRRRAGDEGGDGSDDPANTVTRVRNRKSPEDEITAVSGSTRLEAKKQRRREGREAGRRRAPIISEAEFLARRESVNRVMAIRQRGETTQIGVLEDNVLVEHYVARESQTSLIGNVYLGRVQNVLPSMEAAFVDIGKGRNAVLYAGEVNWSALGHQEGQPRKIESVLSSGQTILVQVTKDPIGHKGARLTSQISLAGRFLVYVPDGTTSGISRKLPDTERNRLKTLLKEIVPEGAGVIVRTAAEGASEEELTRDVERLKARWEDIEKKAANKSAGATLLYGEPDLTLKVVRDLFTEDFAKLVVDGDEAWETVRSYVSHVAPDLEERLEHYEPQNDQDVFSAYRIDEQIKKGLDRKVWLPSGGSLIIDRTEAMTVIDVNTGKFTGSGGNLEETVTKNNLEAAEEIVRQLRLRDIGGIIVVDFIDMVLESNRDLVLRRLVECLGRDRTRHQVAEVTSLGLVQMTRKRIGTGLLESFSHDCEACRGRGVVIEDAPIEPRRSEDEPRRTSRRSRRGKGDGGDQGQGGRKDAPQDGHHDDAGNGRVPSPKDIAAMPRHEEPEPRGEEEPEPLADSTATEAEPQQTETQPEPVQHESRTDLPEEPEAPADLPEEPTQPEAPAEPAAPKVVTRTRRRAASRPAGPPAGVVETASSPADATESAHPEAAAAQGDELQGDEVQADEAGEHDEHGTALHVPVKRKGGARKR